MHHGARVGCTEQTIIYSTPPASGRQGQGVLGRRCICGVHRHICGVSGGCAGFQSRVDLLATSFLDRAQTDQSSETHGPCEARRRCCFVRVGCWRCCRWTSEHLRRPGKRKQDWGFKATKDDRTLPPWAPMPFISRFMLLMVVFVFRASASASHGKGRLGSKTSSAMPDCRTSQPSSPMLFERRLMLVMARLTINASARASQAIGIKLKPRAVSTARPGCHGVRCDSS